MARKLTWVPFGFDLNVAAATSSSTNLLDNLALDREAAGGLTITRVIGCVQFQATSVDGSQNEFALAMRVAHEAQATATPIIASDQADQWIWTLIRRLSGRVTETAAGVFAPWYETMYFDVRAQRKILQSYQLRAIVQNEAGDSISTHWGGRVLIRLP